MGLILFLRRASEKLKNATTSSATCNLPEPDTLNLRLFCEYPSINTLLLNAPLIVNAGNDPVSFILIDPLNVANEPVILTTCLKVFTKDDVPAKEAEVTDPTKNEAVKAWEAVTAQLEVPNNEPVNPKEALTIEALTLPPLIKFIPDPVTIRDPVIFGLYIFIYK
jgi:hypothetical protein